MDSAIRLGWTEMGGGESGCRFDLGLSEKLDAYPFSNDKEKLRFFKLRYYAEFSRRCKSRAMEKRIKSSGTSAIESRFTKRSTTPTNSSTTNK